MTERFKYLDIASGIMIIWVLLYHALYPMLELNILSKIPFLYFFMPWFFYKSGYMFNVNTNKELFSRDFRTLLLPFAFWSIVGYVGYVVMCMDIHNLTFRSILYVPIRSLFLNCSIPLNIALWFLPILFLVRTIANALLKIFHPITMLIVALLVIILCDLLSFRLMPIWISGTTWGLFFFIAAYLLRNYETNKWVLFFCSIIFIISLFTEIPSVYSVKEQSFLSKILWYPCCLCGCITFNNLCRLLVLVLEKFYGIVKLNSQNYCPIISYIGKNSMSFYLPHYIIFKLGFHLIYVAIPCYYSNIVGFGIIVFLYIAVLFPISELRKKIGYLGVKSSPQVKDLK